MVGLYKRLWINAWRKILSSRVLTLDGWVAFDLPRSVTVLGEALLLGLAGVHVYILMTASALPGSFVLYALALAVGCLIAAVTMVTTIGSVVPQLGWYLGTLICLGFLGVYLCSRIIRLPGLESLTGRWDVAPGTLAMALAAGFIALHTTVLSGINVAYPHRQGWQD